MTDPCIEEDDGPEFTTIFAITTDEYGEAYFEFCISYETLPEGTTYDSLTAADKLAARISGEPVTDHPALVAAHALQNFPTRRRFNTPRLTGPWSIRTIGQPTEEDLLAWWRLHGKTTPTAI